ncbi:MAG TPA: PfkB family carbohydrate kinase [Ilumatobacter sp.]|nr:PfkB family carbohydrate kinase [Ilumatobacter sp.]
MSDTHHDQPPKRTCAVLAPLLYLTVTVEEERDAPDVHLHPGGQGFWIARMIEVLGADACLVAPIGGEAGAVVAALLPGWEIDLLAVPASIATPTQVHDRRSGDRNEIVGLHLPQLDRHGVDDLYAAALEAALTSDALVLTSGGNEVWPDDAYGRLLHDLAGRDTPIFADLHGPVLDVILEAGTITVLKVSEEDLAEDGWPMGSEEQAADAARQLHERGASTVVVSRAAEPAIACVEGDLIRVIPPSLAVVDHTGAGDSMTAGMTVGHLLGLTWVEAIRLGAAAGAGNVTRRGLGSGRAELIAELSELVKIEELHGG